MSLELISIGSSSSGNSYIIRNADTAVILDLGLSAKKIRAAINDIGLTDGDITAIFITHEHVDHVKSVRAMSKACANADVYASRGTIEGCDAFGHVDGERLNCITAGTSIDIGDIRIKSFALSHDAREPLGFSFTDGEDYISVVTDTGVITDDIYSELARANKIVFESNHEEEMLMMGPYPYTVKLRILSDIGHLSNVACAETLRELVRHNHEYGEPALSVMLAHLSSTNNTPHNARAVIIDELRQEGYEEGRDFNMTIAAKEGITVI